jgi:hypothetical protein
MYSPAGACPHFSPAENICKIIFLPEVLKRSFILGCDYILKSYLHSPVSSDALPANAFDNK